MNRHNKSQRRKAILNLKKKLRGGDPTAAGNIAATYREIGNRRRAFHWWQKAASQQDGDAWLEVGHCLQYGIGTSRNIRAALRSYRNALAAYYITEYSKEEVRYHLAIALLDVDSDRSIQEVRRLLRQASGDGDFPQAAKLLRQLCSEQIRHVCRCRRGLLRHLGGKANCALHRRI